MKGYIYSGVLGLFILCACKAGNVEISDMKCEYTSHPICVDSPQPRFHWNYHSDNVDFKQGSYCLYLSTDKDCLYLPSRKIAGDSLVWSSGVVESDLSASKYTGMKKLESCTKYYWKVVATDKNGANMIESPIDSFETAKIYPEKWTGEWITDSYDKDYLPSPMLRKVFQTRDASIQKARLYVSAAAYCKMNINGEPASSAVLNPGFTHYDKRNLYSVCDVSGLLKPGNNVISAVLGNGFYNEIFPLGVWEFEKARWRNRARMICELHILYADGVRQVVDSDSSWKTSTGPYLQNNICGGDTYDKQREIVGWEKEDFDDASWKQAVCVSGPSSVMSAQIMPAIEIDREVLPISMKNYGDSVYVYDMGINMAGYCQLSIKGESGTKVAVRHGELLKPDGRLETGNIDIYFSKRPDIDFQTDLYILDGKDNVLVPAFNYHGFQYVEVKADRPVHLTKESLKGLFFHTAVKPVGKFSCSNSLLNDLWEATNQSYLCNLMSIPTDCPQREKNGWTADAHVSMDLGLLNFDGITFYEKWINDIIDNQTEDGRISGIIPSSGWGYEDWIGPVWDAALFIVPMNLYRYYGDKKGIEMVWNTCQKYLHYLSSRENDEGTATFGIGDWCFYEAQTQTDFTTTCYYYMENEYMAKFADLIGKDGTIYNLKAEKLKSLINAKYFNKDSCIYANGTQAAQSIPLYLDIVPEEYTQKVADKLSRILAQNNNTLDFGMLGSKTVLRMLAKYGHANQAYELAINEDMPSWGYWMKQGLTTLSEKWKIFNSSKDQSLNHIFMGDISAWMYNILAGINYDEQHPGFKHFFIQPHFVNGLDWVDAEYNSINGLIKSSWKRNGNEITLNVIVPVNTTATIKIGSISKELNAGNHMLTFANNKLFDKS